MQEYRQPSLEDRPLCALVTVRNWSPSLAPNVPRVGAEMRELAIIHDGAMLIRDGKIEAAGHRSQIEALLNSDTQMIDAGGRVVTPGFVDAHTHLVFAGNRADEFEMRCSGITYQEIARQGGGIRSTVAPHPRCYRERTTSRRDKSTLSGFYAAVPPRLKRSPATG